MSANRRRAIATLIGLAIAFAVLFLVDREQKVAWQARNMDPRKGKVYLIGNHTYWKVCRGTLLLYEVGDRQGQVHSSDAEVSPECG